MNICLQIIKCEEWKSVMQYLIICTDLSCFQEQPSYQHQNHKLVFELASDLTGVIYLFKTLLYLCKPNLSWI